MGNLKRYRKCSETIPPIQSAIEELQEILEKSNPRIHDDSSSKNDSNQFLHLQGMLP